MLPFWRYGISIITHTNDHRVLKIEREEEEEDSQMILNRVLDGLNWPTRVVNIQ